MTLAEHVAVQVGGVVAYEEPPARGRFGWRTLVHLDGDWFRGKREAGLVAQGDR